jgi:hypothetical protein
MFDDPENLAEKNTFWREFQTFFYYPENLAGNTFWREFPLPLPLFKDSENLAGKANFGGKFKHLWVILKMETGLNLNINIFCAGFSGKVLL